MEIPKPDPADLPVGALCPFPKGELPSDWCSLQGQTLSGDDYPAVVFMYREMFRDVVPRQYSSVLAEAMAWEWTSNGGEVHEDRLVLPTIHEHEAWKFAFGTPAPGGAPELVLAIKVKQPSNR
jgi:hypothetical protein